MRSKRHTAIISILAFITFLAIISTIRRQQQQQQQQQQSQTDLGLKTTKKKFIVKATHGTSSSSVVISGKEIQYTYPDRIKGWDSPLVIGVLSSIDNHERRSNVRKTWASNQTALFVVASTSPEYNWTQEMKEYDDLLVLHMDEFYQGLTYKVQAFFHVMSEHITNFEYLLKADDDAFVDTYLLLRELNRTQPNYWGHLIPHGRPIRTPGHKWNVDRSTYRPRIYPPYCQGSGYIVSKSFVNCAVEKLADLSYLHMEDVATGILAKKCGMKVVHNPDVDRKYRGEQDRVIVLHRANEWIHMKTLYERGKAYETVIDT